MTNSDTTISQNTKETDSGWSLMVHNKIFIMCRQQTRCTTVEPTNTYWQQYKTYQFSKEDIMWNFFKALWDWSKWSQLAVTAVGMTALSRQLKTGLTLIWQIHTKPKFKIKAENLTLHKVFKTEIGQPLIIRAQLSFLMTETSAACFQVNRHIPFNKWRQNVTFMKAKKSQSSLC